MPAIAWMSAETPDRDGSGGQRRQYHQIRSLLEAGVAVEVVTLRGEQSDKTIRAIAPVTRFHWNRFERLFHRNRQLARFLGSGRFSGAIVAHVESVPHFSEELRRTGLPWLLDFQNVNSRWHAVMDEPDAEVMWAAIERDAATAAILNTVCSEEERDALLTVAPEAPVAVSGHGIDPAEWPDGAVAAERDRVAVMFGAWDHRPNAEGAAWVSTAVWPAVRAAVPDARLMLAGPGTPPRESLSVDGVTHVGRVGDIASFLGKATVVVVPILRGIGARMKFGEALASGTAVVSTGAGAEGFSAPEGLFLRADDEAAFGDACVRLLAHPGEATALGRAARDFAFQRLAWSATTRPMIDWALTLR